MDAQSNKRPGTAFWFPDEDGDLLRAVAKAEDRAIQRVLSRALRAYAMASPEYQTSLSPDSTPPASVS